MARIKFEDGHTEEAVALDEMITVVELYLQLTKHVVVKIIPPQNDKQLQLLGKAYDFAMRSQYSTIIQFNI